MFKTLALNGLALLAFLAAFFVPRLAALDRYITPDEPKWMMRSANFYHALSDLDPIHTYQHGHPGVTVTWAGLVAFLRRYPQYAQTRTGQIERDEKLFIFLRNHQISVMDILTTGRLIMVLLIGAATLLMFLVASRLMGLLVGFLGIVMIAFDPFFTALSRLLGVDGLMSALMLLSLLSYLGYLYAGRKPGYILLSGVSAGLSWLTKSPAFFLLPFIGFVTLLELGSKIQAEKRTPQISGHGLRMLVWSISAPALVWTAVACATFTILWPAMWVDPLNTLNRIFSQTARYVVNGHENITFFNGRLYAIGDSASYFYPVSFLWRTTPIVLTGLGLATLAMIFYKRLGIPDKTRRVVLYLALFALLFTLAMSFGEKKFDRYILPTHLACDLIAGFGWVALVGTLVSQLTDRYSDLVKLASMFFIYGALVAFQLSGVLQTYPYYLNYFNPLMGGSAKAGEVMMIGWGEGLDQVADYLNAQPFAEDLRVISWYGDGPLSYLFKGQTVGMDVDMDLDFLRKCDYVVLYINQFARQLPSTEILSYFATLTPAEVVKIGNLEYARVYDMRKIGADQP